MAAANLAIVRSIYAQVMRGELSVARWADPGIEWVIADGPEPRTYFGVARMEEGLRDVLAAWEGYHVTVDEYRELDHERVLVLSGAKGAAYSAALN